MKEKILNYLLKKDNLVAVPKSWKEEFVNLAGEKAQRGIEWSKMIEEYNNLLKDFFNECSMERLKGEAKGAGIKIKAGTPKRVIADQLYEAYKMRIEK